MIAMALGIFTGAPSGKRVLYFGCIGRPGHHLWLDETTLVSPQTNKVSIPWRGSLDGGLAPATRSPSGWVRDEAPQGVAALHHKDGWTAIAFWDRSGDRRGNSNSVFLARGTHTFDEMVALSKEAWPRVWARFSFEVTEVDEEAEAGR